MCGGRGQPLRLPHSIQFLREAKSAFRWSPTICCRSLFPWSNRVLLSLNSRNPCSVGGVAIRSSEKCSSWLFSRPAAKYRKRRPKRTASASVVLCAFPFHKDFIHAHAPQPRDRVEVIYARKAPSRLPLVHALRAAQTEVFLQFLHAVPFSSRRRRRFRPVAAASMWKCQEMCSREIPKI